MENLLHFTFETVSNFTSLFLPTPDQCLLERDFKKIADLESEVQEGFLADLYDPKTNLNVMFRYLPKNIQFFSPNFKQMPALEAPTVCSAFKNWIFDLQKVFARAKVLEIVEGESLSLLKASLFQNVARVEFQEGWSETCQSLFNHEWSIWHVFNHVFINTSNLILSKSFESANDNLLETLNLLCKDLTKEDADLTYYMWSPSKNELDLEVGQADFESSPGIYKAAKIYIQLFERIENDIIQLQTSQIIDKKLVPSHLIRTYENTSEEFKNSLSESLLENFKKYTDTLSDRLSILIQNNLSGVNESMIAIDRAVFIGRFAKALSRVLKNSNQGIFQHSIMNRRALDQIVQILEQRLIKIYKESHQMWVLHLCKSFKDGFLCSLKEFDWNRVLFSSVWQENRVRSATETEPAISLLLPVNVSPLVIKQLWKVSEEVNRVSVYNLHHVSSFKLDCKIVIA
jgi:hypothetical protein